MKFIHNAAYRIKKYAAGDLSKLKGNGTSPVNFRFPPSPLGPGRALLDATGLLLVLCPSVAGSVLTFARLCGGPLAADAPATVATALQPIPAIAVWAWLNSLLLFRRAAGPVLAAALIVGAAAMAGVTSYGAVVQHLMLDQVALIVGLPWLVLEVCRRHGVGLRAYGVAPPDAREQRQQAWAIAETSAGLCILTGAGATALTLLLGLWQDAPVLRQTQTDLLGLSDPLPLAAGVLLSAGVMEDVILITGVTAVLTTARRPAWQIYTLVAAADICMHLYLGLPGLLMGINAALRAWLYRTYGRVTPLILGHLAVDVVGLAITPLPFVLKAMTIAAVIFAFGGIERLYVPKSQRHAAADAPGAPPATAAQDRIDDAIELYRRALDDELGPRLPGTELYRRALKTAEPGEADGIRTPSTDHTPHER
ncbi:hypothetical protein [Streptomyces nanshensis]|uniref:Peptidase n=1 Tax=Streptomyces nanshensis TaxID=518642 RepID=A0A1E7LA75_9ACTN|nr:hypothetical protein [Streptomyces nanshensis]OEV13001.1 hypothetical protein AN218_05690 [Streptomyces nanshensis]